MNNRARVLAEVLSVDAWHQPFAVGGSSSAVHVELSFQEGRIGGADPDFPFTFRLNLKRALLTVKLEPPLEIERSSVARSVPSSEVELKRLRVAKEAALASLDGRATLSPLAIAIALKASAYNKREVGAEDHLRVVQNLPETLVSPRPGGSREYTWELEPTFRESLRGQPWNPVDAPRLRVKTSGGMPPLPPTIKVEVSCALCDLQISEIEPKDKSIGQSLRNIVYNDNNQAAAVQHIKLVLRDADLEPAVLDNRFSDVLLASILAIPE
jgi:hypothetical protein